MRTARDLTYIALALVAGWCGADDAALPSHREPATSDLRAETPESIAELRERVSPGVAVAVGWSDVRSSRLRNDAIRALAKPLSEDDVRVLLWFLDEKFSQQEEYDLLTFNALKNDVLGVLLERAPPPEGIGQSLARMFRDPNHDDVWRDYCVQHFAVYYQARRRAGATATDRDLRAIEAAYWEAVAVSNSTTAGTALIGLRQLAGDFPEMDGRRVAAASLALATNPSAEEGARVTAMQICAELGETKILPLARALAADGASVMLRLSAVGVIGRLGTSDDANLLNSLASKGEQRIRTAVAAALKRMEHRRSGHGM
jgi:hypothetical protein